MIFNKSKYTDWYFRIISSATQTARLGYTEVHHIVPRALGGDDSKQNLVALSAREHLVCHMLLTKMVSGSARRKMIRACAMMSGKGNNNSRMYALIREEYAAIRSKEMTGVNNHFYGKAHLEESLSQMRESIQKSLTPERRASIKYARTMWRHNQANKSLWARAEEFFIEWELQGRLPSGFPSVEKKFNLVRCSIQGMVGHFANGWNPLLDNEFQSWKLDYLNTDAAHT